MPEGMEGMEGIHEDELVIIVVMICLETAAGRAVPVEDADQLGEDAGVRRGGGSGDPHRPVRPADRLDPFPSHLPRQEDAHPHSHAQIRAPDPRQYFLLLFASSSLTSLTSLTSSSFFTSTFISPVQFDLIDLKYNAGDAPQRDRRRRHNHRHPGHGGGS